MNNYTKKVPLQNVHLFFSLFFNLVEVQGFSGASLLFLHFDFNKVLQIAH